MVARLCPQWAAARCRLAEDGIIAIDVYVNVNHCRSF